MNVEKIVEQTLLYDFYGELLTEHQRQIYEDVVFNDLSLSEVAEERGISRQGVHDMIRRCNKQLADYEEKLQLVAKFVNTRAKVEQIHALARQCGETGDVRLVTEIEAIASEIVGEL
ncbi:MAG: YlxM family DNA-binding protein [Lachnospiraceae bacterium]|nr:YlxM family DNA-binding protein [Lachnospiraceae bacterium]